MTDYSELVKVLRCENTGDDECGSSDCTYWSGLGCMDGQLMEDAAAAIEALQAQLPERGEWIEDDATYPGPGLSNYKCSLCGKIGGTWRRGLKPSDLPDWCGNCGADMRKMEDEKA